MGDGVYERKAIVGKLEFIFSVKTTKKKRFWPYLKQEFGLVSGLFKW